MKNEFFIKEAFRLRQPNGTWSSLRLIISNPRKNRGYQEYYCVYVCGKLSSGKIFGASRLHAMLLTIRFISILMNREISAGAVLYALNSDSIIDLKDYFGDNPPKTG